MGVAGQGFGFLKFGEASGDLGFGSLVFVERKWKSH